VAPVARATMTAGISDRPVGAPLRVLFLATYFPKPTNPTMGTWALEQARALRRQTIDLRVVSFTSWVPRLLAQSRGARAYAECPPAFDWDGVHVEYPRWLAYPMDPVTRWTYRYPSLQQAPAWWSARHYLRQLAREWRPDVVYAHHSLTNGSLARHLHSELGIPFVVTDHDLGEIADCERAHARRRAFARVVRDAFAWLSVSERMEQEMRRQFPFAHTCTLHNGSNALPAEVLATPRPPERRDQTVVFSAGMFYERKGFPLLIEAFGKASRGRPEARLRIAGDGPARPEIEATIRRAGLNDRVQLLGILPHLQVLQEIVWADAFALAGWGEPFGVVFAEALAAARPVILASDAGVAEVMQDGVHGILIPPRDAAATAAALLRVLAEPALRERLGAAGRALWASRLTWDANATALVSLLGKAVEARQRG